MRLVITGGRVFTGTGFAKRDILIDGGKITAVSEVFPSVEGAEVVSLTNEYVFPGFTDVHVHLREPGFSFKETIASGTEAAARAGYGTVCAMPNLSPVPDCAENLACELEKIRADAKVRVLPYGALTRGEKGQEPADLAGMTGAFAFSDDGKGVQSAEMMRRVMLEAKRLGKVIAAHCEDESLLRGGVVHAGKWAERHGVPGICSESEWGPIARDIALVRETGCSYHVCHVSTAESVELIRRARTEGLDVTCETAPHYLLLCEDDMPDDLTDAPRFKMNPPLRSARDRDAVFAGLLDGTVGMIATDHAPHTAEEKSRGIIAAPMGVTGLECAFPVLYTGLVRTGKLPLEKLVELMSTAPAKRFGIDGGEIRPGARADLAIFDLDRAWTLDPAEFASMGHSTPFAGRRVYGRCIRNICAGKTVWKDEGRG